MQHSIEIARRFNGPATSANGGYTCGLIAAATGASVNVRLHKPPPLDTPLQLEQRSPHEWQLLHEAQCIATAVHTVVHAHVPAPPTYLDTLARSRQYAGFKAHAWPTCFVCGPERAIGDGLRIFPGPMPHTQYVAAAWLPQDWLADADGKVRPEFIWAALDCPGYFASVPAGRAALLGELAVHIDRSVHVAEPCVIMAWPIVVAGRKHKVGTALFDSDGDRCAMGLATWIEP